MLVTKELLDGADVVPGTESMGSESMAQGVRRDPAGDSCGLDGFAHGCLD